MDDRQASPSSSMSHSSRLHSIGTSCFRDRSVGRLYTTLNLSSANPLVVIDSLQARDRYSHRSTAVTWCASASIAIMACSPAHDTCCGHNKGMFARHCTAQHSTAQHSTAQHSTAQHSAAQRSTAQHSTAHVSMIHLQLRPVKK